MEDRTAELLGRLIGGRPGGEVSLRTRDGVASLLIRNEFATVWVRLDQSANGVRLIVTDAETGNEIGLDPLELEAISRMRHRDFDERILERSPPAEPGPAAERQPTTDHDAPPTGEGRL